MANSEQIWMGLSVSCFLALLGILCFVWYKRVHLALLLIFLSALVLRIFLISCDPYLQDWDERFHALVAKNMIEHAFKPMLRLFPIMKYDYTAWCCNHIWVHKQPLFLWQMALSMKVFGINEFALRLPSAVMGALSIFFVHGIARYWSRDTTVAFTAALISCFSFYQLELTTGRYSVDHNDVAFVFYVSGSIWAFVKHLENGFSLKWSILIGIFAGCAVLTKWLPGLLIFGTWGLYVLLQADLRSQMIQYVRIALAFAVACVIFLPWQIYITKMFPLESAASYAHNRLHISEVLGGHVGGFLFHLNFMPTSYGLFLLPCLILGLVYMIKSKKHSKPLTISLLAMVVVVFAFFSLVVATKMPAFTYPVNVIIITLISVGIVLTLRLIEKWLHESRHKAIHQAILAITLTGVMIYSLKPWNMAAHRSQANAMRNAEINNAQIYKSLPEDITSKYVIINCKSFEDVELMFYQNVNAFHWYPEEKILDSLQNLGYKFAAFKSHNDQQLPQYITEDTSILIIEQELK